jgi:hypothetical protein
MNFNTKYNNFNIKYSTIKKNISQYIKKNMVKIGSGGSNNIIIIDNNIALKIIPTKTYKKLIDTKDINEYKYYEKFYNKYIKTNITPHIVGIYKKYSVNINNYLPNYCHDTNKKLETCCPTVDEILMGHNMDMVDYQLCTLKYAYDKKIINHTATCLLLEYCPLTISNEIEKILYAKDEHKYKLKQLKKLLLRVIFQVVFTLAQIQKYDKHFIHNDLFLRNVLGVIENNYGINEYTEYVFNNKSYYLQANGIYIKINDFGYALNLGKIKTSLLYEIKSSLVVNNYYEIKNNKRDIYTFLYDLYNGPSIKELSLTTLIKKHVSHHYISLYTKEIKKVLNKFINIHIIDKIIKKNNEILNEIYNISESNLLINSIIEPKDYFKTSAFDYYTTLPNNGVVIKIFR